LVVGLAFIDGSGVSVYPLSPVQILWENLVTSIFPAFALGLEPAGDIGAPRNTVYTPEFFSDAAVFGLLMGIPPLLAFVIFVYGFAGGNLGLGCNETMNESCVVVFKARAAVFMTLTVIILLHAFEMKDSRRSIFRMNLWRNKTLFFAVVGGIIGVFPMIYIPKLNTVVFKMSDIGWELGVCIGCIGIYIVGAEGYKALKRCKIVNF